MILSISKLIWVCFIGKTSHEKLMLSCHKIICKRATFNLECFRSKKNNNMDDSPVIWSFGMDFRKSINLIEFNLMCFKTLPLSSMAIKIRQYRGFIQFNNYIIQFSVCQYTIKLGGRKFKSSASFKIGIWGVAYNNEIMIICVYRSGLAFCKSQQSYYG